MTCDPPDVAPCDAITIGRHNPQALNSVDHFVARISWAKVGDGKCQIRFRTQPLEEANREKAPDASAEGRGRRGGS